MNRTLGPRILVGLLAGLALGAFWPTGAEWVEPVGTLFLRLLKMLIIPLVLFSMVTAALSAMEAGEGGAKRLAFHTIGYYLLTTALAVTLGLVLVTTIQPGAGLGLEMGSFDAPAAVERGTSVRDILLSFIPQNPVEALADGKVLPVIFWGLLMGFAIGSLGEKGRDAGAFFRTMFEAVMRITGWVIRLTPYGVFAIVATTVATRGLEILGGVGKYMVVVIAGLLFHALITLVLLLKKTGRSPLAYAKTLIPALLNAFSTASSSATLPLTMERVEDAGVSQRTAKFVLPLGATINMDGTALYEAVAVVFIAQAYGMELSLGSLIVIALTATLASIGAAGIPEAGLVTMALVLTAVGLPLEGAGIIIGVDWFLDRFRTTVNVWGDGVGAAVVDASSKR
ncbi:dicarboxylate/amino acid:cation symporter [bacterium]|nr:dicarboxylate/amino acid:cation symporter [bacterium]